MHKLIREYGKIIEYHRPNILDNGDVECYHSKTVIIYV